MNTITIQFPESLKKAIEALAAKEGYTLDQFLASAAGEKLAAIMTHDYWNRELEGVSREAYEKFLAAVPDIEPDELDKV